MLKSIKTNLKTEIIPIILILFTVLSSFYFYAYFPEQVPLHWNVEGEIDSWGSKTTGAFLLPIVIMGVYLLFLFLPFIDPKKEKYEQFQKVYQVFKILIVAFMVGLYFITSLNALGYNIAIGFWGPFMVGLLFIMIGNYLGKIKSNWFVGIKTPWTLSSEEVWNKTHRLGGKIFMLGGLLMMSMNFLPVSFRIPVFVIIIAMILFGTVAYSYILYAKEKSKNNQPNKSQN